MKYSNIDEIVTKCVTDLAAQKETVLMEQLNDLISRNLLVVEETRGTLVHDPLTQQVRLVQAVRLTLKDKEYIEQLETENKDLKARLEKIKAAL